MHRCGGYQKSLSAAVVRVAAMALARLRGVYDYISWFVCPSAFTRDRIIEAGFPAERVVHIPTFIDSYEKIPFDTGSRQILFVGRLSPEKGIEILVNAVKCLKDREWQLVIAGGTKAEYEEKLGQ